VSATFPDNPRDDHPGLKPKPAPTDDGEDADEPDQGPCRVHYF